MLYYENLVHTFFVINLSLHLVISVQVETIVWISRGERKRAQSGTWDDLRGTWDDLRGTWDDLRGTLDDLRGTWDDLRGTWDDLRGTTHLLIFKNIVMAGNIKVASTTVLT